MNFNKTMVTTLANNRDSRTTTVISLPHFNVSILFTSINTWIKKKDIRQIKKHVAVQ